MFLFDSLSLLRTDIVSGYILLGLIAGLRKDAASTVGYYERACELSDARVVHSNFVGAFVATEDWKNMYLSARRALDCSDESDPDVVFANLELALRAGWLSEVLHALETLGKLKSPKFDSEQLKFSHELYDLVGDSLSDVLFRVYGALSGLGLPTATSIKRIVFEGDVAYLYEIVVLNSDPTALAEPQLRIHEVVAEYELEHDLDRYPVDFRLVGSRL